MVPVVSSLHRRDQLRIGGLSLPGLSSTQIERLREVARTLALAGYGLCYSAAEALIAWVSFLVVALWFEWEANEVTTCWEAGSIVGGLLLGAWLAWRAKSNPLAHISLVIVGATQVVASGMYLAKLTFVADRLEEGWLLMGWVIWIGAAAAIAAIGAFCGLAAYALRDSTAPDQRWT
jgi:hypothetical protein